MVDNVELNAGTGGATVATDDVGGVHYQIVKLASGALDAATIVSDAAPLPVDDAGGSLTVDGTVTANLSATDNAVLDQIELNTDFGIVVGGGAEAAALRVTIANDSTGVVTVDGTVTANLSATDNAVLDVIEVNTSYGDNLGNGVEAGSLRVTIASDSTGVVTANLSATDNAVLDVIEVNTSYGDNLGGGVEAGSLRVTIANDSTGVVSVDDGGGALTVDGTVTVAASANLIGDVGLSGARTSGGTSIYYDNDAEETVGAVKASAGQIYWIHAINFDTTPLYLQIYNIASGSVTVGTSTPVMSLAIPTQGDTNGAGFTFSVPNGIAFSTAISVAVTTAVEGAAGPVGTSDCVLNIGYA